jgi:hypothetical protein
MKNQIRYILARDASTGEPKTGLAFDDFFVEYNKMGGPLAELTVQPVAEIGTYQAPTSADYVRIGELGNDGRTAGRYEVHFHDDQLANAERIWLWSSATGSVVDPLEVEVIGKSVPVSQVPVPSSRTWILANTPDGLRGQVPLVRSVGESQVFAIDWRCDLPTNGRLGAVNSFTVISGPEGGISISTLETDCGVDRSQSRHKMTINTVGTYTIAAEVTFSDDDGGGTSVAEVTLVAKDAS